MSGSFRVARRAGRWVVPALAVTALAATAVVVPSLVGGSPARAAAPGQYTVGTTPVALTQPADSGLGRLTPTAAAATQGMFAPQVGWPLVPVHAVLTASGHLVTYGSPVNTAAQGGLSYDDWNPALGTGATAHTQTPSMTTYNAFCNSLQTLPDGRIVMVGGNSDGRTSMSTMLYDPQSKATAMGAGLNRQRWYASTVRLPDDRMLVLGGANYYNTGAYQNPTDNSGVATTPEIGTGTGAWSLLTGATSTTAFGATHNRWWYPRAFNGPDGAVFGISGDQMWRLSASGSGSITGLGTLPASIGVSGAAVMYAPGKLLLAGGGQDFNGDTVTATNATTLVDIGGSRPAVTSTAAMAAKRNWLNLTVLPTGEVLANGGTTVGTQAGAGNSAYATETWNPTTRTWRTGAAATRIRTYHSTAVLMPSGAVFTGGGGIPGPEDNLNAEVYYPSYLFTRNAATGAVTWASRPTITSVAGNLRWGGALTLGLGDTRGIKAVSLVSAAQETHSVNQDQRRIPLTFTQNGGSLTATIPNDRNVVPPGSYLLSTVDANGVPSPGQLVTIRNSAAGSVTVYEPDTSASQPGGGTGTSDGSVPMTIGTTVGLQPVNYPAYLVRHQNYAARLDQIAAGSGAGDRADASFVVRRGLAGPTGVSFEAVNFPGWFLRVVNGAALLQQNDGSAAFAGAATYRPVTGLTGQNTSLQLFSDPTLYLRHQNFVLYGQKFDGSDGFRKDATFAVRTGLADGAPTGGALRVGSRSALQPTNFPGRLVRHYQYRARIDAVNNGSDAVTRADATFVVRAGLGFGPGISFEASNYPGWYLVVDNGVVNLRANDGSAAFAAAATFLPGAARSGTGTALTSVADPTLVLRHQNYLLWAQRDDGSAQFAADSAFVGVAGPG